MAEQMKPIVLDCTLRDGGYYNDWDFAPELGRALVQASAEAGVNVVELGYRSPAVDQYYGPFRYCDERFVQRLLEGVTRRPELAFMIDAKEFALDDQRANVALLERLILPRSESAFSMVRVAAHPAGLGAAREQVEFLKRHGYTVGLNVMGISALGGDALVSTIKTASGAPADVLYFADSYGSLTPDELTDKLALLRAHHRGQIGVHMHENLGLALANTLAAVRAGVDYVDSTLLGMGRGAGNVRTEQLLLALYFQAGRRDLLPSAMLPVVRTHMEPLQRQHRWGWDFSYMLSGLVGIHPTYTQELRAEARYEVEEVARILEDIPVERRARFHEGELLAAEARFADRKRAHVGELPVSEAWTPPAATEVLVVAGGPALQQHVEGLRQYIAQNNPLVLECNDLPALDGLPRTTVVLNSVRAHELGARRSGLDAQRTLATGLASLPSSLKTLRASRVDYGLEHGRLAVDDARITLPSFVVGMLAVAMALRTGCRRITLAGFDGFPNGERRAEQAEMELFWQQAKALAAARGVQLISLLPTRYDVQTRSLYAPPELTRG